MRESVSSWTASTPEGQKEVGGATRPGLIGPQRPGSSAQSRPGVGPSISPSFKVGKLIACHDSDDYNGCDQGVCNNA